jgi:hypothetical protein
VPGSDRWIILLAATGIGARNHNVGAWLRAIHSAHDGRHMRLNLRPSPRRENNDGEGAPLQVLLVGKIAVSGHHDLEAISLRGACSSSPFLSNDQPNSADRIT